MIPRNEGSFGLYEPHGEVRTRLWLLAPMRLYAGAVFLASALAKVMTTPDAPGWLTSPEAMLDTLRVSIVENPDYAYGFYRLFYEGVVVQFPGATAMLVVFAELLVGLCLIAGFLTRLACLAGLFVLANAFFAFEAALWLPDATTATGVVLFTLLLTNAGRAYGLDYVLQGRGLRWLLV